MDDIKSKDILSNENLLQVYSTDEGKSESVIIDESFMKESESENLHKSINTNEEKYAIDETEHEQPLVTYNPVSNEPSYINLFECSKKYLE